MVKLQRIEIGNIPVDVFTEKSLNECIGKHIKEGGKRTVLHSNAHLVQLANSKEKWLIDYFQNEVNYVMCDGTSIRFMATIKGLTQPDKVTYNVWFWNFTRYCANNEFSLFLLGAKEGVAERAAENLRKHAPGLKVYTHHGYYDKQKDAAENKEVIATINASKANVLVTCFGMPFQEQYIKENFDAINANIFLSGGGAIDYMAGDVKICPPIISKIGMEWFYRMCQRPKKLFKRYFFGNIRFLYYSFRYKGREETREIT